MRTHLRLPRRAFLKGLGTTIALPALESMQPLLASTGEKTGATALPKRLAFVYVPNGANMADWRPTRTGADYDLPFILEPLAARRPDVSVLTGLTHDKGRPNGDGAGDHARASASFLTGSQPRKTSGADIKVGVSVDQVAAQKIGHLTRFPSLELGCDRSKLSGNCDSGYSCAYSYNIAWRTASTPLPPEVDPRLVFERLFGNEHAGESAENLARRRRQEKSVLDFVLEDTRQLQRRLGATDRRKLDEYLTAVRELEQRIERAEQFARALPDYDRPAGIPKDVEGHIRLMYDLMALAFQTDTTRVATFVVAHDGSNLPYPFIGVSDGHHDLSHHGGDEEKKKKIAKINRFHVSQFAYFLDKLASIKEGEATLLDQCSVVYGSGLADGNAHEHHDLPLLLAGRGGGTLAAGRHIRFAKETPACNLFLSLLDSVGAPVERLGDSTGRLPQLS
jgi:hypothetical protein